jgi:hypothetical protein
MDWGDNSWWAKIQQQIHNNSSCAFFFADAGTSKDLKIPDFGNDWF